MPGIEKKGRSKIASYKKGSGPCWSGYQMVGMKSKGGRKVPNCVPVKKASKGAEIKVIKAKKGVDVAPYIIKQSSQSGKTKVDDQGVGLDIYSKYGNFGISKNKNTQSSGGNSLKTKSKNITYNKNIKVGKSSSVNFEANYGQSKNKFNKNTTKGGKITFVKQFSKGGGAAIRGLKFQGVK